MSDDSGRSEAKRRLPPGRSHGYGGEMDKRLRTHDGAYRRMRSPSNERGYDIDDGPSTSSSSSRRHFPFSSTSANSSENDEYHRQRTRRMSPRSLASMNPFAGVSQSDARPPLNRMWTDGGTPRERVSHPGPPDAAALDRSTGDQMPSPPGLTLSSGQPIVGPPLKTQAAFVGKLYSMLEDEEIRQSGLLHWSNNGTTFICPNPTEFSKAILPRFFKHNNWQSFVRQLNMYSFNKVHPAPNAHLPPSKRRANAKVNDLYATSNDPAAWEFRHPLFRQGEPHFLASIKRKTTRNPNIDGHPMLSPTEEFGESRMLGTSMTGYGMPPGPSGQPPPGTPGAGPAWMAAGSYPPHTASAMPGYGDPRDLRDPREMREARNVDGRDPRDARDARDARDLRDPREPRDVSRDSRSGGNQVFGIDLKTGKTIESRPYEQTARASTREYFESLRPGSAGGPPPPTHLGHVPSHSRGATEPSGGDRYYDRSYPGERERERLPPPLSAPPRPIREREPPSGPEMPSHASTYPQPSARSLPPSALPVGVPMSEVEYLHDKIARLRDALNEQTLEGLRREMEAVSYSMSLIDWVPNAPPREARNIQHGLGQRVTDLRNEYEAVASRPPATHMDMGRGERQRHAMSISHSNRASQMTESSLNRSSTSTNPVTPLIAHTPLTFSRSSGATAAPGTSGSLSATPVSATFPLPPANGAQLPPPPSAGASPALRKLPLPRPSLESRPSLELRSLPAFPHFPRESMTSPLAFEYLPSGVSIEENERGRAYRRDGEIAGAHKDRVKAEANEPTNVHLWREQRDHREAQDTESGRLRQGRHEGGDRLAAARPEHAHSDEERRLQSPVSPRTTSTSRFANVPRLDDQRESPTSPGAYSAGTAPRSSRGRAVRRDSMHSSGRSNGHALNRSPPDTRDAKYGRTPSPSTRSDGSATSAHALTSPAKSMSVLRGVRGGSVIVKGDDEEEEGRGEEDEEDTPTKAPAPSGMRNLLN